MHQREVRRMEMLKRRKTRFLGELEVPVLVDFLFAEVLKLNLGNWRLEKFERVGESVLDREIPDLCEPAPRRMSRFNKIGLSYIFQNVPLQVANHAEERQLLKMKVS